MSAVLNEVLPDRVRTALRDAITLVTTAANHDTSQVADQLYAKWHARWMADAPIRSELPPLLVEALRAAHADSSRFEDGWIAARVSPRGRVVAVRNSVQRVVDPLDYLNPVRPGLPPSIGAPVRPCARRDSTVAQPGFWITWGGGWSPAQMPPDVLRLYWSITAAGAPSLVASLTAQLGVAAVPYALKLPVAPDGYARTDAGVLFLPSQYFEPAREAVRASYTAVSTVLREGLPPLVEPLATGLGVAEDPGTGESFGSHRCRLIAEAVLDELRAGRSDEPTVIDAVRRRFASDGVDPMRPHLRLRSRGYSL